MSTSKQSKGIQIFNPFLALSLIPFLPLDRTGGSGIRSEEKRTKSAPREHKHRHHHHHHHHKSEDSSKSTTHSQESSHSSESSSKHKSSRSSADESRSDRNREYFVLERDVKKQGSSRR